MHRWTYTEAPSSRLARAAMQAVAGRPARFTGFPAPPSERAPPFGSQCTPPRATMQASPGRALMRGAQEPSWGPAKRTP
eukprot:scaffold135163_cov139-Phaeocystis_antarctica.AAC.1